MVANEFVYSLRPGRSMPVISRESADVIREPSVTIGSPRYPAPWRSR
jgi:hypothetical protein